MTQLALHDHHPAHRDLRMLGADLVFAMPFVGELARKAGTTLACNADAERLLSAGELVGVWPEGFKGIGKPFADRYKLQRFGRGGFVAAALRTGVPIIPCAIVGAEEIYPMLGNVKTLARLLGLPYFPMTPTFPLLGPLGARAAAAKWIIEFGEPIATAELRRGRGGRPDARVQPHRPGPRDDPADPLPAARAAPLASSSDARRPLDGCTVRPRRSPAHAQLRRVQRRWPGRSTPVLGRAAARRPRHGAHRAPSRAPRQRHAARRCGSRACARCGSRGSPSRGPGRWSRRSRSGLTATGRARPARASARR